MKTSLIALSATLGLASLLTGCGDNSTSSGGGAGGSASPPPPAPAPAAAPVAEAAKKAVDSAAQATTEAAKAVGQETAKAADATKEKLQEAAKAVQAAVAEVAPAAQEKFNALVAEVKKLIADGKGTEAVQKLQSAFSGLQLTPEQQKMVDDLKKAAQDALSKKGIEAATKAASDFLAPKPKN